MRAFLFSLLAVVLVHGEPRAEDEAFPDSALMLAYDGAMTCAAITALKVNEAAADDHWKWENRSFAFGMLASRFWTDATSKPMDLKLLDEHLNKYMALVSQHPAEDLLPFIQKCRSRYPQMDELCVQNGCLHPIPDAQGPAGAPQSGPESP